MKLATTPIVCRLTGLTKTQLREWTKRRALIPADKPASGKGSPARFSWQTVLVIRIAAVLRKQFNVELQAHQTVFAELQEKLRKMPFLALRNTVLIIRSANEWKLASIDSLPTGDAIVLHLNTHLETLSTEFAPRASQSGDGQLSLIPVHEVVPGRIREQKQAKRRSA